MALKQTAGQRHAFHYSAIAFGLKFGKIVIGLHLEFAVPGVISAATPAEAVQLAFQAIG